MLMLKESRQRPAKSILKLNSIRPQKRGLRRQGSDTMQSVSVWLVYSSRVYLVVLRQ